MSNEELGADLLIGASAIAAYLNVSPRRIYHWAKRGYIPTFNIGPHLIAARRSELDEALRKGAE